MLKKFLFISILLTTISILCANNISLAQTSEKLQQSIIPTYARYLSSESEWREWSNKAINWAEKCMKDSNCSKSYRDYCLTFVAEAFIGASKQDGRDAKGASWESPKDAIKKLGNEFYSGNKNPPRGALVFFSGQGDYSNYGHIGIYLGNDRVIHAYGVVKKNSIGEIENLTYIDSYLGWAYPPKAWFGARRGIQDEQKNALRNELQKWEKLITQTQFEDISKRINIIARTWRVITDKATGVKLNEDYQKLYGLAKNYLDKARSSINESRTHFERGELDQAKSYLSEAQKNLKIAQDTYQTAIQVLQGQLEAGEILAKGLQQASDVALTGLAALVPGAQQVVDRFLLVRDFIADSSMEGINQASKEAIVKIAISKVFNEFLPQGKPVKGLGDIDLSKLSGRLTEDPNFRRRIENEILKAISQYIAEDKAAQITQRFMNQFAKFLQTQASASVDKAPNVTSFSASSFQINQGQSVTLSYSVSDDVGLNRVELWRADDTAGVGFREIKRVSISGKSYTGSFSDTPTSAGTYRYGVHVVDTSGKWNDERNSQTGSSPGVYGPKQVVVRTTVTPLAHGPTPSPSEGSFVQPCPDAGGYRSWLGGPNKNHLGHDYNAPAGTPVRAIADGTIVYANLNVSGFGGSEPDKPGPMMWIRHRLSSGKYFYALYGHIKPIKMDGDVKIGETIGTIIPFYIGKDYCPHLHLGIWNSESNPPLTELGYGSPRNFTNPIKFLGENRPYIGLVSTPSDIKAPNVTSFSASASQINQGQSVTLSYSVMDDVGLKQVELWRADDTVGVGFREIKRVTVSGKSYSGSFSDTPTSAGTYRYGIHVVDTANKWNCERNSQTGSSPGVYGPKQVVVKSVAQPPPPVVDKHPNVNSFSASASGINQGQSVTLSYSVVDDVGLKQVELWRADDTAGVGFREIKRAAVLGKQYSGSISDTPTSAGTYRYGVHVVDTSGKWNCERNSQTGSSPGVYGPKQVVVAGAPTVDKPPNVTSFSASSSQINQGQSVTLSYSVVDDVGLKQVELWRADDTAGVGFREIKRAAVLGKQYSGSISDTPTSAGTYRYGVHVVDTSGKWNCERNS
ncbi:MAG: peptidoglycan DD-metalloendopeptidase family protein, partial [Deltaproteobacteria bacterium]|nr:peptidoglycan DD-metalloendopeptidase family protein [Deltaproteobacteria bacterium]